MSKNKDWSVIYGFLQRWIKFTFKKLYYREVVINNIDNIPDDSPIIFAPNHQNALMDPFCVITSIKKQPFFLARQDFFKTKLLKKIFTVFKMLPVYRIRDGYGSLQKNEEIFKNCADILSRKNCLGIMPEGNHAPQKRLRPFGKGVVRVAFASEKIHNNKLGLKVVPVGINYKDVNKFRSRLLINFGKPISVSDFHSIFLENEQAGYKALNDKIREELIPQMIHIETDEIHDLLLRLREFYNSRMQEKLNIKNDSYLSAFNADKKMIEIFETSYKLNPEISDSLCQTTKIYSEGLTKLKLRDHILAKKPVSFFSLFFSFLFLLILLPFQIFGMINNYLPYKIPVYILNKKSIDSQFISSISYGLSFILLFPLFYTIILLIVLLISGNILIALAYLVVAAATGLLAIHYWFLLKKFIARIKFKSLLNKKDSEILDLLDKRKEIIQKTDEIIDKQLK